MKSIILRYHEIRCLLDAGEALIWRPVKPQPRYEPGAIGELQKRNGVITHICGAISLEDLARRCPCQPGEWRWVREAWWDYGRWFLRYAAEGDDPKDWVWRGIVRDGKVHPMFDQPEMFYNAIGETWNLAENERLRQKDMLFWRKRSPLTMPRWASRLTVEIVSVGAKQVQQVTEEDALRAGADKMHLEDLGQTWSTYRRGFQSLWDFYYAKRGFGWGLNPWAWVVETRRVEG